MKCSARRSDGEPCAKWAIRGGSVCNTHGGSAPAVRAKAAERLEQQRQRAAAARLGCPSEVDPADALLALIYEAAGNVEFYRSLVAELPTHPAADSPVPDGEGGVTWQRGEPGIYGRTYHQSGIPTGEAKPHVLVTLYDAERDRLAQLTATALKLGLDERRVRLAEADARRLFTAVSAALHRAALTGEQQEAFRAALAAELRSAGGAR